MTTTIWVSAGTKAELKKLKAHHGLKSVDDVISMLISEREDPRDMDSGVRSDEEPPLEPQQKRKKLVREPLFSFQELADRHEMMEYYTGFPEAHVRLLIKRLQEVITIPFRFRPPHWRLPC